MGYNGREVMRDSAQSKGWTVLDLLAGERRSDGLEFDLYLAGEDRPGDKVLVGWTPENTAPLVSVNGEIVTGPLALIEARRFIEEGK